MDSTAHDDAKRLGAGVLRVVGTPIGNLSDMSSRAVESLATCNLILCEDTRVTKRLCAHFGIATPLLRCDENTILKRIELVCERLRAQETLCLVSDAGMPCISDPGQRLVDAVLDEGLSVEVIPGPSAVSCALAASGLSSEHFFFEGFLPRKKGQLEARLSLLATIPATLIIYESPHRLISTLEQIDKHMSQRRCAVGRELTKLHEELARGSAADLVEHFSAREGVKGECVIVVEAPSEDELSQLTSPRSTEGSLDEAISAGIAEGRTKSALAKELSKRFGLSRDEVYRRAIELSS